MNDDHVRDAIQRAAASSPRPIPFEHLDRGAPPEGPRNGRALLAMAAVAIVLAGVAGVAWVVGNDDETVAPATVAPQPTAPPAPTADTRPITSTEPSSTEPSTTEPSSTDAPSTDPSTTAAGNASDDLFPVDDGLASSTAIAPSGSIDGAPGDIVSLSIDGDLYLHQGAFDPDQYGRPPSAPIRLVDGEDPRTPVEEGPGPNGVSWIGGFVNGALIYGDCCEPVIGNVYALSDADGQRYNLRYGSAGAADPTGRRWALVDSFGVQVLDFDTGRGYARSHNDESQYNNDVLWSPDGTEVWVIAEVFDDAGTRSNVLLRYDSTSLTELGRVELLPSRGTGALATFAFAGHTDAAAVVTEYSPDGVWLHAFVAGGFQLLAGPAWSLPTGASSVHLSADGSTLIYTVDDTAYLHRRGEAPVEWGTDMIAAWFVTTPSMSLGTADCDPSQSHTADLWRYADLDGDGVSERVIITTDAPLVWYGACGSPLSIPPLEMMRNVGISMIEPVDIDADGRTELWITDHDGASRAQPPSAVRCGSVYGLADGVLAPLTGTHCVGAAASGFGCVSVDGTVRPVFYERSGLTLTARLDDGTVLGTHTYSSEEEFSELFDLAC